ncbi:2,3-diaminopropionate biosynthesis protein SbnA [Chitinophaga sp. MD30]|nr:2,3-diaminopropionate biosynthesis protein SbnA [Chitinophaga sp. MD30]
MISSLQRISHLIGNTPVVPLDYPGISLYAKLEYKNYSGSVKDRAALSILSNAIHNNRIDNETLIVESSSGNFAIALSRLCKDLGLRFIPVIDPNINAENEAIIRLFNEEVVKVDQVDSTGGYLLTRIEKVKEICAQNPNSFWTNQYENPDNYMGYYHTLGKEICDRFEQLDYLFIAVSSCGTIAGVSKRVKEKFPNVTIVGVDLEGSVIFGTPPKKRYVSGLGASKVPAILKYATIDETMHVSHEQLVSGCHELVRDHNIFAGASTGAVYSAIDSYFSSRAIEGNPNVLFICADKGDSYINNVYNEQWVNNMMEKLKVTVNV